MKRALLAGLVSVTVQCACAAAPRQWSDSTGKFQVQATLVTIKDGKAYLEKIDGARIAVDLAKLSQADLQYLSSLPEYRGQVARPVGAKMGPGVGEAKVPAEPPKLAVIHVPDESTAGEVRRFTDLGGGLCAVAFSPDGGQLAVGKRDGAPGGLQ